MRLLLSTRTLPHISWSKLNFSFATGLAPCLRVRVGRAPSLALCVKLHLFPLDPPSLPTASVVTTGVDIKQTPPSSPLLQYCVYLRQDSMHIRLNCGCTGADLVIFGVHRRSIQLIRPVACYGVHQCRIVHCGVHCW